MALVFHPPLTHYPFALLTSGSIVYLYGYLKKKDKLIDKSIFMVLSGIVLGIFAGLAGLFDASRAGLTLSIPTFLYHISLALSSLFVSFLGYMFHLNEKRNLASLTFLIGFMLVLGTGFFGGEMVFTYGVNVG